MSRYEVIEDGDYKVTIDYENLTTTFEINYQSESTGNEQRTTK